ncbi:transmembrane protein 120B-A-like isoform X2 [Tubulanus polymorphus]|uniref:transmembrane protein 120B-A-like isoform X2 n=1 Tax=Tubulanus polymorphus TaxID=672921 RepID=UPI003DA24989
MDNSKVAGYNEEWLELNKEWENLERAHEEYSKKVVEVTEKQKKCLSGLNHQTYRLKTISDGLKRLYLNIILGQVNVSLLSKEDRFAYKQNYERFKLIMNYIILVFSFVLLTFVNHRWSDAIFHFLLVWYYCTLTIREHILINNGSRIKGWWVTHHFISTLCAGIFLIWPEDEGYILFRTQLMVFSLFLFCVSLLQSFYQQGQLYRLRSLGERHNMDITVEGFHSWMWKGLTFLLPALFLVYFFQLYNAYTLFQLYRNQLIHTEWQVPVLSGIFLILFLGNFLTSLAVVKDKMKQKQKVKHKKEIKRKYSFGTGLYEPNNENTSNKRE